MSYYIKCDSGQSLEYYNKCKSKLLQMSDSIKLLHLTDAVVTAAAFRQWASSLLKQYMLKGYVVNHNAVSEQKYEDLKRALGLLENVFNQNFIMAEQQAKELTCVIKQPVYRK